MDPQERTITIKFEKDPAYRRCHATGFWGGFDGTGELVFDVIEDTAAFPESLRITAAADGTVMKEERVNPDFDVIRIRHIGVAVPMSIVPGIIAWLQSKVQEYNALIGKPQEDTDKRVRDSSNGQPCAQAKGE